MQSVVPEETTNCALGDIETSGGSCSGETRKCSPLTLVEINYSGNKDSRPSRVIARRQVADRLQVRQRAITSAFDNYSQRRANLPQIRKLRHFVDRVWNTAITNNPSREVFFFS